MNEHQLTMYKKAGSVLKLWVVAPAYVGRQALQLSWDLTEIKPVVGYYPYTEH